MEIGRVQPPKMEMNFSVSLCWQVGARVDDVSGKT